MDKKPVAKKKKFAWVSIANSLLPAVDKHAECW